jgi:hypothetical protein
VATAADTEAYRQALQQFADSVRRLDVDPASLPVGTGAVSEADAMCVSLGFLLTRQSELRRWTCPQAFVDEHFSPLGQQSAANADRVLGLLPHSGPASTTSPSSWSLRGRSDVDFEITDILADLRFLAEASNLNWDELLGRADSIMESAIEDDDLAFSRCSSQA